MSDDLIKREDVIKAVAQGLMYEACVQSEYASDELSDWIEVAKDILEAIPSADRPQGEWIDKGRNLWGCSNCGMEIYSESEQDRNEFHKWCSRCGCRMKGADDE